MNSDGIVDETDLELFKSLWGGADTPYYEDAEDGTVNKWSYRNTLIPGPGAGATTIENIADPETGNHFIHIWTSKYGHGALLERSWKHPVVEWEMKSNDIVSIELTVETDKEETKQINYQFNLGPAGENHGEWRRYVRDVREGLNEDEAFVSIQQIEIRACFGRSCSVAPGELDIDNIRFLDSKTVSLNE